MRGAATLALLAALWLAPGPAAAQVPMGEGPAILVADSVYVTADRKLVAEGRVEAFQGETRLTAERIVYDQASGQLTIDGPIRIEDADGSVVLASAAELDDRLESGLLTGARLVFNEQVQLASTQMTRAGGRYTQLFKTAVTSCHVCDDGRPPLWSIRARKVIHDEQERQLYFEDAQLRVLSVPIFYLPRLRLPDPTLRRARGFLIPEIQTTSQLGTGVKVPYFIPIGDSADLTLTPYWSPGTRTLDFRYRQAFWNGDMEFEGAVTRDDLLPGEFRGYLFGYGSFELRNRFRLTFDFDASSDDAYLKDYGISDADRLRREIELSRSTRTTFFGATAVNFNSLRDSENDSFLPTNVLDLRYQKRFYPSWLGGEMRASLVGHSHTRDSNADILGRDMTRTTAELMYLRSYILPSGLRSDFRLGISGDAFGIQQDSTAGDTASVVTPQTAVTLSYPVMKATARASQIIEPVVQLAWSDVSGDPVPNDESNLVEFDEGNLLALSRFPAADRREDGLVLAYGLNWTRTPRDTGWGAYASFGHVIRDYENVDFSSSSGLSGTRSDFLVAGQLLYGDDLILSARTLFDDEFEFTKAEVIGAWVTQRSALAGSYLWLDADPMEGRVRDAHEVFLDGAYDIDRHWTASANWRYDINDTRPTNAGIGLGYRNECVEIELTVDRRYTSSTTVEPSTIFGFTISLRGFGTADGAERYPSQCQT
ncbi:LPS-assembly protein LptD [Marinibacterium profundimaris]|uniref:LPS-assembly protein LptD n=1 Tax=Marinibacterium profundimaris TaxID=1679460 RepID=A0A225NSF5_9RHOB|nr:LPS assembly protein LptD [Marinibacterium profundimaris]OWU77773.1 organic solvent tolerance protein [Marinibacterium profundimaris]